MVSLGVYIHIPFCASRCTYCDFYSGVASEPEKDSYVKAVLFAIQTSPYAGRPVDTVYFGGGTPSVLGAQRLTALLQGVAESFPLASDAQITLEVNPESATPELLRHTWAAGFNRLSVGIQSADSRELEILGRAHSWQEAETVVENAYTVGFRHLSGDMMLGLPYQNEEVLGRTISKITALPFDHLSVYMLQVEPGTPLATCPVVKEIPDDDGQADLYLYMVDRLAEKGFIQYEISNFAKAGGQSVHNRRYWESRPYLGIGPAAHSFVDGRRFGFPPDRKAFVTASSPWDLVVEDEDDSVGSWQEYAMLRLRLAPGLDLEDLVARFPQAPAEKILRNAQPLLQANLVTKQGKTLTLTPEGFLVNFPATAALLDL